MLQTSFTIVCLAKWQCNGNSLFFASLLSWWACVCVKKDGGSEGMRERDKELHSRQILSRNASVAALPPAAASVGEVRRRKSSTQYDHYNTWSATALTCLTFFLSWSLLHNKEMAVADKNLILLLSFISRMNYTDACFAKRES